MATRKVFYSFHYKNDAWRASQVRNMGAVEGNPPASDNDWEKVQVGGDTSIKRWIDNQLNGRSATVVLIGRNTAGRKWINYEIEQSWNLQKGLLGINIHALKNRDGEQAVKGENPFGGFTIQSSGKSLSDIVKTYDPPYLTSKFAYEYISDNLSNWIEESIKIRNSY